MGKLYRSARGVMVDFDLLAIKAQLAAQPTPTAVSNRNRLIAEKDGVKPEAVSTFDILAIGQDAAMQSAQAATSDDDKPKPKRGSQLTQK